MSRLFCFHSPDSPEVLREKLEQWITAERWKEARQALSDGRWSCRVRWRRKGRFTLKEKHWRAGETGIYTFSKPYWGRTDAHRPITPAEKMPRPFGEQRAHVVGGFHIGTHAEAYFPRPFSGRIRPDGAGGSILSGRFVVSGAIKAAYAVLFTFIVVWLIQTKRLEILLCLLFLLVSALRSKFADYSAIEENSRILALLRAHMEEIQENSI